MKPPYVILASSMLLAYMYLGVILFKSDIFKANIRFDYNLKFTCNSSLWNQFAGNKNCLHGQQNKHELKTSLICTSNTFGTYDLVMSHISYNGSLGETVRMGEGTFAISGEDGQQIFGTYEGYVDHAKNRKDVLLFLCIKGGTGDYEGVKGYLSARCVPDGEYSGLKFLTLKGSIRRVHKKNSILLTRL